VSPPHAPLWFHPRAFFLFILVCLSILNYHTTPPLVGPVLQDCFYPPNFFMGFRFPMPVFDPVLCPPFSGAPSPLSPNPFFPQPLLACLTHCASLPFRPFFKPPFLLLAVVTHSTSPLWNLVTCRFLPGSYCGRQTTFLYPV